MPSTAEEARDHQDRLRQAAVRRRQLRPDTPADGAFRGPVSRPHRPVSRSRRWVGAALMRLGRALAGPAASHEWSAACEPLSR